MFVKLELQWGRMRDRYNFPILGVLKSHSTQGCVVNVSHTKLTFMSHRYLSGGVASGFNHVEQTMKIRLFHVKGKSTPRIREVQFPSLLVLLTAASWVTMELWRWSLDCPFSFCCFQIPISWDKVNDGDAYILDVGSAQYVWCGKGCSFAERKKVGCFRNNLSLNCERCEIAGLDGTVAGLVSLQDIYGNVIC